MNVLKGEKYRHRICVVKGDTLEYFINVVFDGRPLSSSDVSHLYFSSDELGVTKELTYTSTLGLFRLAFTASETSHFPEGRYNWDLTLYSLNQTVQTCVYNDVIIVFPKNNRVNV